MLLDPRPKTSNNQHRRHHHSPERNMQIIDIKRCLHRRNDGPQLQNQQRISQRTVILVHTFPPRHAPKSPDGEKILCQASQRLQDDQDIGYQAQHAVWGGKACMIAFVDFDGDEGHDEGEQAERLDGVVEAGSGLFLECRASRLEN